jgi:mannose-6-phosphate isomerase
MANSDNVIRGGLTSKYTDIRELLSIVLFEGVRPEVLEGTRDSYTGEWIYRSLCPDFLLSTIRLASNESFLKTTYSAEILLIIGGVAILDLAGKRMPVKKGDSIIIFAGQKYRIHSENDELLIFRATVPELRYSAK